MPFVAALSAPPTDFVAQTARLGDLKVIAYGMFVENYAATKALRERSLLPSAFNNSNGYNIGYFPPNGATPSYTGANSGLHPRKWSRLRVERLTLPLQSKLDATEGPLRTIRLEIF